MSDMHTPSIIVPELLRDEGLCGAMSPCVCKYKEDNGDLKHGDILPIEMT